jgi:hypothetical protein
MRRFAFLGFALLALASPGFADTPKRSVEIRFAPNAPRMQIVVWIEDAAGKYIDTAYITRLTGQFGLANRPGSALLKTAFGWPYGRREMVLPIWAHKRDHHYPKVVMGGACGNSTQTLCPDGNPCSGNCDDTTIAYHGAVSSTEPFYCAPNAAPDAMSCASPIHTLCKGAYADQPAFSLYPPRADLVNFQMTADSKDAMTFAANNDLVMISAATPPPGKLMDPSLTWYPPDSLPDGDYVAWLEMSAEGDFNQHHNYPCIDDSVEAWNFEGHQFLGQPSVVYKVPFKLGPNGYTNITSTFAGYGDFDGQTGTIHDASDGTISTSVPGSGGLRLMPVDDGVDNFLVKVVVGSCEMGDGGTFGPPQPVSNLSVTAGPTSITVDFGPPTSGTMPNRYAVHYRQGDTPITDDEFNMALSGPDPPMDGSKLESVIQDLIPTTTYTVAVRGISQCGQPSPVVSKTVATTMQKYVVLNGCFVATAAYGSPMENAVDELRTFRDHDLLPNPAGRLFVASYYAFSPPLARAIAGDKRLRALARVALKPLVDLVEKLPK